MADQYDPKEVIVTVNGLQISGFVDGEFINYERDKDSFVKRVGADGRVTRAKSNDKTGLLNITLLHTSPSNDVLSALHIADQQANNGVFQLLVVDLSGASIIQGEAWVRKPAPFARGNEVSDTVWPIDVNEQTPVNVAGVSA